MKVTIDKAGRLVVPKEIRTKLQIRPGDELEIEAGVNSIEIRPVVEAATLTRRNGLLVVAPGEPSDLDLVAEIARLRTEQEERILGGWSSTTRR